MSSSKGKDFTDVVAKILRQAQVPFSRETVVNGLPVDFAFQNPDGKLTIIETKAWNPTPSNRARAAQQAELFRQTTGAEDAMVVLEGIKRGQPSKGVVSVDELRDVIANRQEQRPFGKEHARIAKKVVKNQIFAAMPFAPEYDDVYFVAMAPAADSVAAVCKRIDQEKFAGDIVEEIERSIRAAKVVIADLSEAKSNVLYETGFAHALGKPTIHICSTSLDQLPFDVRNWNTIKYVKGQTHKLKDDLIIQLKEIL